MNSETSPRRRAPAAAGWILLGLLGLLDVFANGVPDHRWTSLLPMVSGPSSAWRCCGPPTGRACGYAARSSRAARWSARS
ncbi:hypothetical protein [Streptomyces scabiei]|uniref:hypothetical protein n=1 Tax=Streptomyces scabiei TaxID=1930 RepID=UPI001FF1627F|nr:hypothetical protein [Streptomyces sp. LBUM 1487]